MTSIQNEVETRWKCFDEILKKKKKLQILVKTLEVPVNLTKRLYDFCEDAASCSNHTD